MNIPTEWALKQEYEIGYTHAIEGYALTAFWVKNSNQEWKNAMNGSYRKGYQAGRKQLLINLIKEDPK